MKIKKGDTVVVITGKDISKKGHEVLQAFPQEKKVLVEGVNMVTRHTKARKMGEAGGRIKKEAPVAVSNVMILCPKCDKAVRVGYSVKDGNKFRICKKCGANLDK